MELQINGNKIFAPLKNKELVLTPEERVRQEYICRLVNVYGYSLEQMAQEVPVSNSHRGQGKARADIVIWRSESDKKEDVSAIIVVECKAEYVTIQEEDYYQGSNYASWAGADFFVTTNLKETRIFKVVKGKIPKRLEEIVDIPKAEDLTNAKKIKELLSQTKAFTRDEFSRLLFKCHNIIRNNDKLSPEAAFDEISKVLFIKIRYERDNTGTQIFSKEEFTKLREAYDIIRKSRFSPNPKRSVRILSFCIKRNVQKNGERTTEKCNLMRLHFLYYQDDCNGLKMAFKYQSKAFANPVKIRIFV